MIDEKIQENCIKLIRKAEKIFLRKLKKRKISIYKCSYAISSDLSLDVFICFDIYTELKKYTSDGTLETIKSIYLEIMDEVAYTQVYSDHIRILFRSVDEAADERQKELVHKAIEIFLKVLEKKKVGLHRLDYFTHQGDDLDVCIFYKTDRELKQFEENGITEQAKQEFMKILEEIGYIEEFNDNVRFVFDSDEHVQRNYNGNYGLRFTDD